MNTWQSAGERSRCASNDLLVKPALQVDQQLARRLDPVFISALRQCRPIWRRITKPTLRIGAVVGRFARFTFLSARPEVVGRNAPVLAFDIRACRRGFGLGHSDSSRRSRKAVAAYGVLAESAFCLPDCLPESVFWPRQRQPEKCKRPLGHRHKCNLSRSSCQLTGVKRTWVGALHVSAYDPKRTLNVRFCCDAQRGGRRRQIATAAIRSIGAVFSLTRAVKRPHELAMDSSHHARRIRARARRLSAGAWDMRMR